MDNNVKLIRLQSGEDIIAGVTESDEGEVVTLASPMVVIFKRLPTGKAVMMMAPWLPIELIKHNAASVYTSDILTIVDPKSSMINYYTKAVHEADELLYSEEVEDALNSGRNDVGDEEFVESMSSQDDETDEEEDEMDIEMERMDEILKGLGPRKRTIH